MGQYDHEAGSNRIFIQKTSIRLLPSEIFCFIPLYNNSISKFEWSFSTPLIQESLGSNKGENHLFVTINIAPDDIINTRTLLQAIQAFPLT